jgi:hypothetical protein
MAQTKKKKKKKEGEKERDWWQEDISLQLSQKGRVKKNAITDTRIFFFFARTSEKKKTVVPTAKYVHSSSNTL